MTIIAGFPTKGFVVLGADGEEGDSYEKSPVRKIAGVGGDTYKCLIGGAGHGDFIDLAIQTIEDDLRALAPATLESIRLTMEDAVTSIYNDRIDSYPEHKQDDLCFELLSAVWTKESSQVQLVRVGRAFSLIKTTPDVLGKGAYLARYLIQNLEKQDLQRRQFERMCAYVLAKVKMHVKDCGGATQVVGLNSDGSNFEVPGYIIREDERVVRRGDAMSSTLISAQIWALEAGGTAYCPDADVRSALVWMESSAVDARITNRPGLSKVSGPTSNETCCSVSPPSSTAYLRNQSHASVWPSSNASAFISKVSPLWPLIVSSNASEVVHGSSLGPK